MIGLRILQGAAVEFLMNDNEVPPIKGIDLMTYLRSRPRATLPEDPSRSAEVLALVRQHVPWRVFEALKAFELKERDLAITVNVATSVSGADDVARLSSLYGGEFLIKSGMRVVASPWGLAWWDDSRTTTSYVTSFDMVRRIRY